MKPEHVPAVLAELGRLCFVELVTTDTEDVWRLTLTRRNGGYAAETFRGTLTEVLTRASSRDAKADSLSR